MDLTLLLGIGAVVLGLLTIWGVYAARRPRGYPDTGLATSTEGMKVCPHCGMGNLWTERTCSACGSSLPG